MDPLTREILTTIWNVTWFFLVTSFILLEVLALAIDWLYPEEK